MNLPDHIDVLVAGGGHAGLCAAIAAREQGAEVVLCEHAPESMRAGNTRHTRNLRAMHGGPLVTLEGSYDEEEYWQDLLKVTGGRTSETLARLMISRSESLVGWLEERGVHFQPALSGTLNLSRTNAFFLGGGKALANALYRTAIQLGVVVTYDSEVSALEIVEGQCKSITIIHNGNQHHVKPRAVVIASGGFQANETWMREAWGEAADNFLIRGTPYNTGTLLKALIDAGAVTTGDPTQCHAVAIDARGPRYDGGIVTRLDCVCFSIVVNTLAQRFYDEGEDFWPKRYAIWGRLIASQPGQIAYAIIDAAVQDQFMPSVFPPIQADSISALAAKLELDAAALEATVDEFNRSVIPGDYDPGVLDGCSTAVLLPPKSNWARPICEAPFSAYPLRPGITFTYLGAKIDSSARVLFEQTGPSPNVFAAGEVMAGNILGQGYCAGTGMTIGGVFGRIAGENAAGLLQ